MMGLLGTLSLAAGALSVITFFTLSSVCIGILRAGREGRSLPRLLEQTI